MLGAPDQMSQPFIAHPLPSLGGGGHGDTRGVMQWHL
jgi:hypothetical protein